MAVLFAFLMASYLIADKLQSSMAFIVVGLFTLVVLQQRTTESERPHSAEHLPVRHPD